MDSKSTLHQVLSQATQLKDHFHYWDSYYINFPPDSCQVALKKENTCKNHCLHYAYPYDHNQISTLSEYINASPIDLGNHKYIAAQGPRKNTFSEFWKMVWLENVGLIVSCTNEWEAKGLGPPHKFDAFWHTDTYGDLSVACIEEKGIKDWDQEREERIVLRTLRVTSPQEEERTIHQLHMLNWMDGKTVHADSLVQLSNYVDEWKKQGPIVVHCAAGIGRTGTLIAYHSLYHDMLSLLSGNEDAEFDIKEKIASMREQRYGPMIAEGKQFLLVIQALQLALNNFFKLSN